MDDCQHDWEDVGDTVWYDDYDHLKVPGVRGKIDSNHRSGAVQWFRCNYKGYKINAHPCDMDVHGNAMNRVCLKCHKKETADEQIIRRLKRYLEQEYQLVKNRKDRKRKAEKIWEGETV